MTILDWSSQSPELLWRDLKMAVPQHLPSNLTEVERISKEEWQRIPKSRCETLVAIVLEESCELLFFNLAGLFHLLFFLLVLVVPCPMLSNHLDDNFVSKGNMKTKQCIVVNSYESLNNLGAWGTAPLLLTMLL